ncbi:MAG: amino acid ABC transporter permease [Coriobacteriales bacterium]|jgi:putative lysine transport system permease protein|nr:amino acid ABC transporter permease [Coriobacteriales bacterium]
MGDIPTTFTGWVSFLVERFGAQFAKGTVTTLEIAFLGTLFGCLLGFLVGIVQSLTVDQHSSPLMRVLVKGLKAIVAVYVEVFRGTPMMVQAMVIYYGSAQAWGIDLNPFISGILVLSLNTGAYMAESVRGAITGIDPGQLEGAYAIGFTHVQAMLRVVIPQAFRNLIPQIGNTFISAIKDTSVLNVISVTELYFIGRGVSSAYYRFFETYFIISMIYLFLTFVTSRLLGIMEKHLDGAKDYELVVDDLAEVA